MKSQALSKEPGNAPVALNIFLGNVGVDPITGWRWRKKGWLTTTNICGRLYLMPDAIAEFNRRAAAGEFAKAHKAPSRQSIAA